MYNDIKIVGFKSQFGHSFYDDEIEPLFDTIRGPGLTVKKHVRVFIIKFYGHVFTWSLTDSQSGFYN